MTHPHSISVAIIGCGIFGAMASLRLAARGAQVTVYERQATPLQGASYNNQNRLHLGFHYPRDDETARQSIRGFMRFREEFGPCILGGFPNAYFVASQGSLVTAQQYLDFCQRMGLRHERIDPATFDPMVRDVDLGVLCDEVVYDSAVLSTLVLQRLTDAHIEPHFNADVQRIERRSDGFRLHVAGQPARDFDAVVNSTYANVNAFTEQLGHDVPEYQYEYTMVPIVEWDHAAVGVSIMDGPFMTVLPFGQTGRYLLYHVAHSVVAEHVGRHMPASWVDKATAPARQVDGQALFERMRQACSQFVPALASVRLVGFLEGPRMVLAHRHHTDARPSIVRCHEPGYVTAFTGKIDHCIWVADDIANLLLDTATAALQ